MESVADSDTDWRKGAQPVTVKPPSLQKSYSERFVEGERYRERTPVVTFCLTIGLYVQDSVKMAIHDMLISRL